MQIYFNDVINFDAESELGTPNLGDCVVCGKADGKVCITCNCVWHDECVSGFIDECDVRYACTDELAAKLARLEWDPTNSVAMMFCDGLHATLLKDRVEDVFNATRQRVEMDSISGCMCNMCLSLFIR